MISLNGVSKVYGEGEEAVTAVQDVQLDIADSEFVSIVGPSGCGKSTLLHLVAGIIEPTSGSIEIAGTDVQSPEHKRQNVGLVFQRPVLLDWRTVKANIFLPIQIMQENDVLDESMEFYQRKVQNLISLVGLDGFEDAYPQELSGGMQQRVTICQSLIYDPEVLLMDEPFGALDALTRDQMNNELLRIWRETRKTVLFVTHDLAEAAYLSDRVVILTPRPAEIIHVQDISLDRPRVDAVKQSTEYNELVGELSRHIKGDTTKEETEVRSNHD